jgi:hypothetical protein
MVQIGNIHLGKAETAERTDIDILEAALAWDLLTARYKCILETQIYHNYAHDPDFREIIEKVGIATLEKQANQLEKQLDMYRIPLPDRPPKSVNSQAGGEEFKDEYMFGRIFQGCQNFIDYLAFCLRSTITNDPLRTSYTGMLEEEIVIFDRLCKYGKMKGWLQLPPVYKAD